MLHGTLDTLDLGDVLVLLEMGKKTGALEVESDDGHGVLFLIDGRFVGSGADEADPHPSSLEQFEAELVDACAALLGLESGTFRFLDGRTPSEIPRESLPISPILADAKQAAAQWREVAASIPSLDAPVLLVPELPADEIVLDRRSWRVLALVDGSRSVRDLARDLARNMADVGRTVAELSGRGVVAFFEAPADPVLLAGEPAGPTQWARAAEPASEASGSPFAVTTAASEPAAASTSGPSAAEPDLEPVPAPPVSGGTAWTEAYADPAPTSEPIEPVARSPRSVSELAAWSELSTMPESDPYALSAHNPAEVGTEPAPAPEVANASTYVDGPVEGTDEIEPSSGAAADETNDSGDDDMRRDRGALLRMFSALKE